MYARVNTDIHLAYLRVLVDGKRVHDGSPTLLELSVRQYLTGLLAEWWDYANKTGDGGALRDQQTGAYVSERTVVVEAEDQYRTHYTVLRMANETHVGYMEVQK